MLTDELAALATSRQLGRLRTTTEPPSGKSTIDVGGEEFELYSEIHAYGARSFSIWQPPTSDATHLALLPQVYDSGDDFEQITSTPKHFFNSNSEAAKSFDSRSDDKGPEPESVTLGVVDGRTIAFVGLERMGGVMAYDVTDPNNPSFLTYVNTRVNGSETAVQNAGDLAPEGLVFISAADAPKGKALLIVSNEFSGTIGVFQIVATPNAHAAASVVQVVAPRSTASAVVAQAGVSSSTTVDRQATRRTASVVAQTPARRLTATDRAFATQQDATGARRTALYASRSGRTDVEATIVSLSTSFTRTLGK
jgi:hypothetical protein